MKKNTVGKRRMRTKEYEIILDDLSFEWTKEELKEAQKLYASGIAVDRMARILRPKVSLERSIDEVSLLLMHLSRQNKIIPREKGVLWA